MNETFTILITLGGGVIAYLLRENQNLKSENRFLMLALLELTTAIEQSNESVEYTKLKQTAAEIKKELRKKLGME